MSPKLKFCGYCATLLALVLLTGFSHWSARFDRYLYDHLAQCCQSTALSNRAVVLINIDQQSLRVLGGWPLSRALHAQMLNQLSAAKASSITYNIAFVEPDNSAKSRDNELLTAMQNSQGLVLPLLAEQGQELLPLAQPATEKISYAHADLSLDEDGVVRRHYLHAGIAMPRWPSLALATVQRYAPAKTRYYAGVRSPFLHIGFAKRWSRDFEILLPLALPAFMADIQRVSFQDVLAGKVAPERFKNKAVFVGLNNPAIEPLLSTASGQQVSATELQAFLFSALEQRKTLTPVLPSWSLSLALTLALLLCGVAFARLAKTWQAALVIASIMLLAVPAVLYQLGFWISALPMLAAVLATLVLLGFDWLVVKRPE